MYPELGFYDKLARMKKSRQVHLAIALSSVIATAQAQTFTTLKQFGTNGVSGGPWSTMVEVQPGLFYGTNSYTSSFGGGALFSVTSSGTFTYRHLLDKIEADRPIGQLIQASDGLLYGTTFGAGIAVPATGDKSVLFRSDLNGDVTVLVDFTALNQGAVASPPTAGADGAIYGTVGFFNFPNATGIVYRYTLDGKFTVLHTFGDLETNLSPLVQANDGNLYGTAQLGTSTPYEVIYRISPSGQYKPLLTRQFDEGGTLLGAGLDGKLYGVDGAYVATGYAGAAFRLNLDGSGYQVLEAFGNVGGCINELTGLTLASDGSLYGGCSAGFANENGGVFRLTPTGGYEQVYSFTSANGSAPSSLSGLATQGSSGVLYGELFNGDESNPASQNGIIYALSLGLPKPLPRAELLTPSSGPAGTSVLLFGSGFLGATSVWFNGIPAAFTVPSGIYIQATVPAGATSGPITITTHNGTATSRVSFTVQ